jgi:methylated-DNA-[protein]-cysteine S-methyltransferase
MPALCIPSPLGELTIVEDGGAIVALDWGVGDVRAAPATALLKEAAKQLTEYFAGGRAAFDLPLAPAGTAFQRRVWDAMLAIPFAETATYGDIAASAGGSARSVGTACGRNPIPVIIPCHRVVAAGGRIGGYSGAGGTATKHFLLALEATAAMGAAR